MDWSDRYQAYDDREQIEVAKDFKGDSIFAGEECYEIEGVYVFEDDLKEYIEETFGKVAPVKEGAL